MRGADSAETLSSITLGYDGLHNRVAVHSDARPLHSRVRAARGCDGVARAEERGRVIIAVAGVSMLSDGQQVTLLGR